MMTRTHTDGRTSEERQDIWAQLAAMIPVALIEWRQDGRPTQRDGKFFARFAPYIQASTVRERLDGVVAGEWDFSLEPLPLMPVVQGEDPKFSMKGRMQILGVVREDVGQGKDYKAAATDAFKRAARRFGIGHELETMKSAWVQVDGDGKYAKPLEDPGEAYAKQQARGVKSAADTGNKASESRGADTGNASRQQAAPASAPSSGGVPRCPRCSGPMWDNRHDKRGDNSPDFKCKDRNCAEKIWLDKKPAQRSLADDPYADDRDIPF